LLQKPLPEHPQVHGPYRCERRISAPSINSLDHRVLLLVALKLARTQAASVSALVLVGATQALKGS
jgi:hypothetical protein